VDAINAAKKKNVAPRLREDEVTDDTAIEQCDVRGKNEGYRDVVGAVKRNPDFAPSGCCGGKDLLFPCVAYNCLPLGNCPVRRPD
jgi:hypothetical protein